MKTLEEFATHIDAVAVRMRQSSPKLTSEQSLIVVLTEELWKLHKRCDELERQLRTKQSSGRYGR